jgi:hypothetical protein
LKEQCHWWTALIIAMASLTNRNRFRLSTFSSRSSPCSWRIICSLRYTEKKRCHTKLKKGFAICNEFETLYKFLIKKVSNHTLFHNCQKKGFVAKVSYETVAGREQRFRRKQFSTMKTVFKLI